MRFMGLGGRHPVSSRGKEHRKMWMWSWCKKEYREVLESWRMCMKGVGGVVLSWSLE